MRTFSHSFLVFFKTSFLSSDSKTSPKLPGAILPSPFLYSPFFFLTLEIYYNFIFQLCLNKAEKKSLTKRS